MLKPAISEAYLDEGVQHKPGAHVDVVDVTVHQRPDGAVDLGAFGGTAGIDLLAGKERVHR